MTDCSTFSFELCVDCLEFCPNYANFLACGMYRLVDDENQRKVGAIGFLKTRKQDNMLIFDENYPARIVDSTSGVFQLKWFGSKTCNSSKLAHVTNDGFLSVHDFSTDNNDIMFSKISQNVKITDDALLNLDFFDNQKFVVSTSRGCLHMGNLGQGSSDGQLRSWEAHFSSYGTPSEVWCCTFNPFNCDLVFSGGDDCALKLWDLRCSSDTPSFSNKNLHKAGVTCIACCPDRENLFCTGSYDDTLRLWDMRYPDRNLHKIDLGGGVWNVKFNPSNPGELLCACMYNGWAIVKHQSDGFSTLENANLDGSLLYGVDWYPANPNYFACCTFYDNTVRLFERKV